MTRLLMIASALLCAALLVAACGDSSDDGARGESPASEDSAASGKDYTIGVDLSDPEDPLFVQMQQGIDAEAKKLGVTIMHTNSFYDPGKQLDNIQNLLTQNVDALLVSPADVEASVPAFQAAKAANIPAVAIADHSDESVQTSFVGAPWDEFGSKIAEWTCDKAGGKGEIATIGGPAGVSFVEEMKVGYRGYIEKDCPGMKIVSETNVDIARETALGAAQDALTAHPNLRAIFANTDTMAAGVIQALRENNKFGNVLVTGFNGDETGYSLVKKGELDMTIALKPYAWGQLGLRTVVDILNGKDPEPLVRIDTVTLDGDTIKDISLESIR
jgi:ribose transport system substrate-binding protein